MNNNFNGINMNIPNQIWNLMNSNFGNLKLMQMNNQLIQMNQIFNNMNINNITYNTNTNLNDEKLNQIVGLESVILINLCKDKYSDEKYQEISHICVNTIKDDNIDRNNIAIYCAEKLKMKFKGQWFVLIQNEKDQNFDFRFSNINLGDMIIFKYKENYIYVSQLIKK